MRIAIDATVLWGSNRYSGVEKAVDRIVRRMLLQPRGHQLRVYVPHDWAGFQEGPAGPMESVRRLPFRGSQRLCRIAWQQLLLPLALRTWRADLVFCPTFIMPLLAPCPAVVLVHDLHGLRRSETRLENYLHYRLLLPPTLRRASGVLATTHAVLEEVRPWLSPRCRVGLAPLGVDPAFRPAAPGASHPPTAGSRQPVLPYILFVGNLEERKGLRLLLRSYALLRQRTPVDLVLTGKDRGLKTTLQRMAVELGIAGSISFRGYVPEADLPDLYRGAAVLALPSLAEGFGLPPLEAMACGTPVVAVDTPAVRENLQDAACLVPADPAALSTALERVLEDPSIRQDLVQRGLSRSHHFTWDATTTAAWELIETHS